MSQGEDILRAVLELANRHDADAIQAYLAEDMRFRNPITGDSDASGMHAVHSAIFAGSRTSSIGSSACCLRQTRSWSSARWSEPTRGNSPVCRRPGNP